MLVPGLNQYLGHACMFKKIFTWIKHHPVIIGFICIVVGSGVYYKVHSQETATITRYVLGTATRGTIITSVSGSGQVAVVNQVDVTPKVSGTVLKVLVTNGQEVKAGTILAQLDNRSAQKTVRDASANLQSARLALQKLQQPPTALSLLQSENSLAQAERDYDELVKPPEALTILQAQNTLASAKEAKTKTASDLAKAYDDGFTAVTNFYVDTPKIMSGLFDALYGYNLSASQQNIDYYRDTLALVDDHATNYRLDLVNLYQKTKNDYDKALADFKAASRFSSTSTIETLVTETGMLAKNIAETLKNLTTFIRLYQDSLTQKGGKPEAFSSNQITALNDFGSSMASQITSLTNILNTFTNDQNALVSADRSIAEKTTAVSTLLDGPDRAKVSAAQERIKEAQTSLEKLKAGTDALDLRSQLLSVQERTNSLADAKETLADYTVRAPIDGTIAKINVQAGNSAGSGTAVVTLVARERIATISLNEVDVAKIKLGEKVTLTFDALPDLSISGRVSEIDTLGTVSQGVVTYNIKIAFDTQDERVKPGMSVTAAIITNIKQDILTVPNGAIKTRGTESYVELPAATEISNVSSSPLTGIMLNEPIREQAVETGLVGTNMTEVLSGLTEGDTIITRTITTGGKTTAVSSGQSILSAGGTRGIGGGNTTIRAGTGNFGGR